MLCIEADAVSMAADKAAAGHEIPSIWLGPAISCVTLITLLLPEDPELDLSVVEDDVMESEF